MYTSLAVADQILKSAKKQGKELTPMQLVKLTYIAHGWSLVVLGKDLFADRIEAWKYGPVIPNLYQATKIYGRNPIPSSVIDENSPSGLSESDVEFIDDFVSKYGNLDAYALSNMTHQPGTPWSKVYKPNVFHIEIPDELIKSHYNELLHAYTQSANNPSTS